MGGLGGCLARTGSLGSVRLLALQFTSFYMLSITIIVIIVMVI